MVSKELADAIRAGKITGLPTEEQLAKLKAKQEQEQKESFAQFSEWIARGAMSYSKAFSDMKEVSEPVSRACRAIMKEARRLNIEPTECIDKGCEFSGIEVSTVMEELDNISRGFPFDYKYWG